MTKRVCLLSGGLDSAAILSMLVSKYDKAEIVALSFSYGQKHDREIENAKAVAKYFGVKHVIANVDKQLFQFSTSTLLQGNGDIQEGMSYDQIIAQNGEGTVDTYVPFRNGLMLSQAAALAYDPKEKGYVYYGAHADDAAGAAYPDCSPGFYKAISAAIFQGTGSQVKAEAPLINLTKAQVTAFGKGYGEPFELTRSCYEGHDKACGRCATCIDRLKAFKLNGMLDPVPYEEYPEEYRSDYQQA